MKTLQNKAKLTNAATISIIFSFGYALSTTLNAIILKDSIQPLHLIIYTNIFVALFALTGIIINRKTEFTIKYKKSVKWAILASITIAGFGDILALFGLQLSNATNFGILFRLLTVSTYIASIIFTKEKVNRNKVISILIGVLGAILVVYNFNSPVIFNTGDILFILVVIIYGVGNLINQKALAGLSNLQFTLIKQGFIIPFQIALSLIILPITQINNIAAPFGISILTFINILLLNKALSTTNATHFTVLTSSIPIFMVILGFILQGEMPTINQIIGGIIVIVSMIAFTRSSKN